jgi:DNA replication and repair protein RecF
MLLLKKIKLTQFKNYLAAQFDFTEKVIGICGLNGKGKTNLLDAIYYCCFTKSYFSKSDNLNTKFDADGFRIEAILSQQSIPSQTDKQQEIVCIFRGNSKKELLLNGAMYSKLSEHIGKFPVVMIAPDDVELITGGSEERRKFIDTILSQMDTTYLAQLIIYNKVLLQRNSLLKRFADQGKTDIPLLEVLDNQLIAPGNFIFTARKLFTTQLIVLTQKFYHQIANNNEVIDLQYQSQLNTTDFSDLLFQTREKDFILQRTNGGIHKDDLTIELNQKNFKITASQGQRKSLLFALKLAEFEMLLQNKGFAPLLLLDDVFEKLDDERMQQLLQWVCVQNTGQVFITDTHQHRLQDALQKIGIKHQMIIL